MKNLKVITSGRMEDLSARLGKNLKSMSTPVFSKTMIITQGAAMNSWLITTLTQTNAIFANYAFQNQDGFMGKVYELLTNEKYANNRDVIKFGVYRLIGTEAFKKNFGNIASYFEGNDLRRIQLSEKIADLFDQYQLYRADMINGWEQSGENRVAEGDEKWQQWLWNELKIPSKYAIRQTIYERLKENADKVKQVYPEIHLFGISVFTGFHLGFYKELSNYIPVTIYLSLPCENIDYQHTLLESMGAKNAELINQFASVDFESAGKDQENPDTTLKKLQVSIRKNEELEWSKDDITDGSILVSSHYTPAREVEALYNYLLDLFENKSELKPSEILVVAPDVNVYEPFIKAVFRNAPVRLPVRVSGAARNMGNTITAALELICTLGEDELTAENVVSLLEQERIGKAYQIKDTAYVRSVVSDVGIRFGWENEMKNDSHLVSFNYGLERIILGYTMLTDDEFDVSYRLTDEEKEMLPGGSLTTFPYRDTEAQASHDLLRLKAFVDDLVNLFQQQASSQTLSEWKTLFVEGILSRMVWSDDFEKEDRKERNEIFRALNYMSDLKETDAGETVPWKVFLNELKTRLFAESREHEMNTGAITFTSAIPVRGLPYKVIAFIGLNNDAFPRQDHHLGFDLMGNDYQPGDRSKKEADKSLFLDTLMAAREKLYLSYIGQSVKDNAEIPPSIVLDTLIDHLKMEEKVVKHPLHGFSRRYDGNELFTYLYGDSAEENIHKTKETETNSGEVAEEIWVNDFVKFFEAPIDWYFKKVLGVYYGDDADDTLPETELFGLDNLQKWQVKNDLLTIESEEKLDDYIRHSAMKGKLPLKNLGRKTVEDLWEDIAPLRERFLALTDGKKESGVSVDLVVKGFRIKGIVKDIFDGEYIHVSMSKDITKYKVRAYVTSLLLFASGAIKSGKLLTMKDKTDIDYSFQDKGSALKRLEELAAFLEEGKKKPLIFTVGSTKTTRNQPDITLESVGKAILKELDDSTFNGGSPANPYIQKLMDEGYFDNLTDDDVGKIKILADLLKV